jgi:hypothetical protein
MKKIVTLALCAAASQSLFAQQSPLGNNYFKGPSASLGISSNKSTTTAAWVDTNGSSNVGIAKFNYSLSPSANFRLGLSLSADLKNSTIAGTANMKRKTPTEATIEPGVLLSPITLAYAKFGNYYGNYATGFGSQSVTGTAFGLGLKSYLTERTFIAGELTQHKASGSPTLGWDNFKQRSTSVSFGYDF